MSSKITFCENCRKDVSFTTEVNPTTHSFKGEDVDFIETIALCGECEKEVWVSDVHDYNLKAMYDAYRLKNDIVSLEHICEIPVKYAIGKRPLSLLLGWGELTFTRYCDGDMPTKQYSDVLQRIYDDPVYFLSILEDKKSVLKSIAYKKSKEATQKLLGMKTEEDSKINCVVKYIFSECNDITSLTLQKSLYYIQGFYYSFHNIFIFEDDCEAWVHGPVYKEIYQRYSCYRFDPIGNEIEFDDSCFCTDEKVLIDSVIKHLCCYGGKTLENFTHMETPWLKTRGDLPSNIHSTRIISKELIGDYFTAVRRKYNMLTPSDIKAYSTEMFDKI